jgi:hypothetical protein
LYWSLILKERGRVQQYENVVIKGIFASYREEATAEKGDIA